MDKILTELHALWCSLTGQVLRFKPTERLFWEFNNQGFTSADMRIVVGYMQRCNAKGGKYKIMAHKVLGDLEIFASILADAEAKARNARSAPTEKEKVIAMRERAVEPETADSRINGTGLHFKDILKGMAQ